MTALSPLPQQGTTATGFTKHGENRLPGSKRVRVEACGNKRRTAHGCIALHADLPAPPGAKFPGQCVDGTDITCSCSVVRKCGGNRLLHWRDERPFKGTLWQICSGERSTAPPTPTNNRAGAKKEFSPPIADELDRLDAVRRPTPDPLARLGRKWEARPSWRNLIRE